jgi:hypothetical protein
LDLAEVMSAAAPEPALWTATLGPVDVAVMPVLADPDELERPRMTGLPAAAVAGVDAATPMAAAPARVVAPAAITERRLRVWVGSLLSASGVVSGLFVVTIGLLLSSVRTPPCERYVRVVIWLGQSRAMTSSESIHRAAEMC